MRALLYALARLMGDTNAIGKGRYPQRLIRKKGLATTSGLVRRLLG